MTLAIESGTVEVEGRKVGYREAGDGPPALFAHCSLAYSGLWKGVIERLAPRWRCIAFDMPGHGASDRGERALSLQLQAVEYVRGAAAALGAERAHLVGLSLGGAVMARVAVKTPPLARSLTMLEPVLFHLIADKPGGAGENDAAMRPVYEACEGGRFHDGARAFMKAWGQPGQFDRMPAPARNSIARALGFLAEDFDMVGGWPPGQITPEAIASIAAPTLLMQGAATQASAKAILDEIARLKPGAERAEIENAGHLSPVDAPEAVAARLAAFFAAAEAG